MLFTTDTNEHRMFRRPDDFSKNNKSHSERGKVSFGRQYSAYDEEDDYSLPYKGRKGHDSRGRGLDTDDIELSDKLENIKRFEREKKAAQKKSRKEEDERRKKPIPKQKRNSKDLTRDYNYGLLDEEIFM